MLTVGADWPPAGSAAAPMASTPHSASRATHRFTTTSARRRGATDEAGEVGARRARGRRAVGRQLQLLTRRGDDRGDEVVVEVAEVPQLDGEEGVPVAA